VRGSRRWDRIRFGHLGAGENRAVRASRHLVRPRCVVAAASLAGSPGAVPVPLGRLLQLPRRALVQRPGPVRTQGCDLRVRCPMRRRRRVRLSVPRSIPATGCTRRAPV
jgi:hypothetical protein